jgi:hypothetical protein
MILLPPVDPAPVHVIVDHIPTAPGLPIWVTTLISAGIGAVFGILSGSVMEVLKPLISRRVVAAQVKPQLIEELKRNLEKIGDVDRWDQSKADKSIIAFANYLTRIIDQSKYSHYIVEEPLVIFDLDRDKWLASFYATVANGLPVQLNRQMPDEAKNRIIWGTLVSAKIMGEKFLDLQK